MTSLTESEYKALDEGWRDGLRPTILVAAEMGDPRACEFLRQRGYPNGLDPLNTNPYPSDEDFLADVNRLRANAGLSPI